ncbi:ABC transporter ATP-binding protein [Kushneria phosphatilytica]|uniref:Spermidine/putrescine import ATP-binding protein PotA n=1 Tax=Kushneria phosphatilytica TaxID=657387 RepID=A0A5C1A094_9GAMM|nr:ABC transporter ATP-binding protein [Kushneria phosphatilytica]QEL11484.1 ABC transporter ATP-binding protein [Kushneria phosphatilytica]
MTQSTAQSDMPDRVASADTAHEGAPREASSISLRRLKKSFGVDAVALAGVDLDIRPGEFFTLLGPSGCGKTTLLRLLAGLELADDGHVEIGGRDVTEVPPHKRSVNTVFQSYALFTHLSVRDNIAFGLKMRGVGNSERQRRVGEIADFIKLGGLIDRRVDQLSGGQRQRIALARALVCEPDVLLLDEPLSALDAGLRSQLQVELQRIQKRLGMTFVFVTHDQQEAMVMSDRIAVLNDGCIQQIGSPREIYEKPVNRFVASFMGHENLFDIESREGEYIRTAALGWLKVEAHNEGELVMIRPEALELGSEVSSEFNRFEGEVREFFYRGSHIEYRLDVNGMRMTALSSNQGQRLFQVGDRVPMCVWPEDLVTLAR